MGKAAGHPGDSVWEMGSLLHPGSLPQVLLVSPSRELCCGLSASPITLSYIFRTCITV